MIQATKKQMVDFINTRCRTNGEKFPKYILQQCPKEVLMDTINTNEKAVKAFEEYVKMDNEEKAKTALRKKNAGKQAKEEKSLQKNGDVEIIESKEMVCELEELVDKLIADPTSFLAIMKFKGFMDDLPYGKVSNDTLNVMYDRVVKVNPTMAYVILKYSTNQTLYLQK